MCIVRACAYNSNALVYAFPCGGVGVPNTVAYILKCSRVRACSYYKSARVYAFLCGRVGTNYACACVRLLQ